MGKSTPSAPQQPSASSVIGQQTASNVGTAIANARLNNTNQVGPNGSLTYAETGGGYDSNNTWVPQFTATTALSPGQQKLYNTQQSISQGTSDLANSYVDRIKQATAQPFTMDGMPQVGALPDAPKYNADYRQHEYDTILQRAAPAQQHDQSVLSQRLADQGVGLNDPGYATAMRQYDSGVNDFRLGADLQAQDTASKDFNTATQGFGNEMTRYGATVDTRNRAIQEALLQRTQPINEVSALMGTGPGVQMPSFVNTPQSQVAPTDVTGAYAQNYAGQMAQYQSQMQQQNASMGGLAGLVGTLGGAGMMAYGMPGGLFGMGGRK